MGSNDINETISVNGVKAVAPEKVGPDAIVLEVTDQGQVMLGVKLASRMVDYPPEELAKAFAAASLSPTLAISLANAIKDKAEEALAKFPPRAHMSAVGVEYGGDDKPIKAIIVASDELGNIMSLQGFNAEGLISFIADLQKALAELQAGKVNSSVRQGCPIHGRHDN